MPGKVPEKIFRNLEKRVDRLAQCWQCDLNGHKVAGIQRTGQGIDLASAKSWQVAA